MAVKVGISGFGRISRVVIRAAYGDESVDIRGINVRNADIDYLVYMLKSDSTFGRFPGEIERYENGITIDGKKIPVYSEEQAINIPWGECGAEYILEGTGAYTTTEKAMDHIKAGAKKVLISAPAKDKETPTYVMGVNHTDYEKKYPVVSNASCTTNCLAPLAKVIHDNWGIQEGLMSTIHAATAKQKVVDARSMKDWRTGRSVFGNIIPTTTGAAKVDLNLVLEKSTSYEAICKKVKEASETHLKGILEYVDDEVVSGDFIGDPNTSIFDARQGIELNDKFFKLVAFYDNEYGYSCKCIDMMKYMNEIDNR